MHNVNVSRPSAVHGLLLWALVGFVVAFGSGLLHGVGLGYDAGARMSRVIASCPNYDSVAVSANPWRAADQQTRPPRILKAPECQP